jgi:ethanolamine permease
LRRGVRSQGSFEPAAEPVLKRTLGVGTLWALGVGYVISGMYFGWNLGLPYAGTFGLLAVTFAVSLLYVGFVLGYTELASAIPKAGGAFVYATRALGPRLGVATGVTQWVEFVFAPPAIAAAIGAYFGIFLPTVPKEVLAVAAYVVFTGLNMWGVKLSALLEVFLTLAAVLELLLFCGLTLPHASLAMWQADPLPQGPYGIFLALPFAVWFYLGIEGIANVSEEAKHPGRDVPRGFGLAMVTLVFLAFIVLLSATGVQGWRAVVYPLGPDGVPKAEPSDSPLPLALAYVVGAGHPMYHLLVVIGLFGLLASFHGILLAGGRVTMELGRAGLLPRGMGAVHAGRRTPVRALAFNAVVGVFAILSGKTDALINLAVMGALLMYILAACSHIALRKREPALPRPFRAPGGVALSLLAIAVACVAFAASAASHPWLAALFIVMVGGGTLALRARAE